MKYATLPLVAFLPKCIRIRAPPDAARSEYFLSREISPSRVGTRNQDILRIRKIRKLIFSIEIQ